MSDTTQATSTADAAITGSLMKIPCTKSKGYVEVDVNLLPDDVLREVYLQGLKVLINRGMSKVTKAEYPAEDDLKAKAQEIATKNVEAVMTSKIKFSGGIKTKKASGEVMTEARRIARAKVKDALKANGEKPSLYSAKAITEAANALIEADPSILETAKANIEARKEAPASVKIDIKSLIKPDPKLVAKAQKEKADKASQLSAKQAGIPGKRSKGQQAPATH